MGGCPKCRKRLTLSDETLRTDLRLREVSEDYGAFAKRQAENNEGTATRRLDG